MQHHRFRSKYATNNRRELKKLKKEFSVWESVTHGRSFLVWNGKFFNSNKEKEIEEILKEQNIIFYREVSFDMKTRFDFFIPLLNLVIEYDGYFHNDLKQMEKDRKKEVLLTRLGIRIIRYTKNHDLKKQIPHDLVYHSCLKK